MPATAATLAPYALLDSEHVVVVQNTAESATRVYRLSDQETLYVDPARLTVPTATPTLRLTEAQRIVALYRFADVATDTDDFGAELDGAELRITSAVEALATLDAAIELCADTAADGVAGRRVELGVTRRLRARVLAAVLAA